MSYHCQNVCEGIAIIVFQWFLEHCLEKGGDKTSILDLLFSNSLSLLSVHYSVNCAIFLL